MMQELPVAEKYFSEPLIINPSEPSEFRLLSDIINPRTILLDSYYGQPSLANIEILRFLKTIGVEEIVLIDSESSIEEKDVISRIIDLRKINEVPWVKREIPEEKQGGSYYGRIFSKDFSKALIFFQDPFIVLQNPQKKLRYSFFADSHYDFVSSLWKGIEEKRNYSQCYYSNCPFSMERQRFSDFIWSDEYKKFLENIGAFLYAEGLTVEELLEGTIIYRPTMQLGAERLKFYGRLARFLESTMGVKAEIEYSDFIFDGGNIVSNNDWALVGWDVINHNALWKGISYKDAAQEFTNFIGKPVIALGNGSQHPDLLHIDMAVTLTEQINAQGKTIVMVADTREGSKVMEKHFGTVDEPVDFITSRAKGIEILRARIYKGKGEIADELDCYARQLEYAGFSIVRIPMFISLSPEERKGISYTSWEMYNNVLQYGNSTVVIPAYQGCSIGSDYILDSENAEKYCLAVQDLNQLAIERWKNCGFKRVIILKSHFISVISEHGAGLRCLFKVIDIKNQAIQ